MTLVVCSHCYDAFDKIIIFHWKTIHRLFMYCAVHCSCVLNYTVFYCLVCLICKCVGLFLSQRHVVALFGPSTICNNTAYPLGQCFAAGGMHTTGGTLRVIWWYTKLFWQLPFLHNSVQKILIAWLRVY